MATATKTAASRPKKAGSGLASVATKTSAKRPAAVKKPAVKKAAAKRMSTGRAVTSEVVTSRVTPKTISKKASASNDASVERIVKAPTTPASAKPGAQTKGASGKARLNGTEGSVERVRRTRVASKPGVADDVPLIVDTAGVSVQVAGLEPTVVRPEYWERACADLVKRDRIMKKLIPQFGPVHLMTRGEPFLTLARSIVGQQISVKAAQTVWDRLRAACPSVAPAAIVKLGYERLAACGLSKRKAEYILDLGQHFLGSTLHVDRWATMDDEDVVAELLQIRGIGRWTAEMFLIFNLMRPDVLPLDDPGLIKAISVNYFSGEPVTRSEAREVAANWEPWRTVATWYMWRSLYPTPVVD